MKPNLSLQALLELLLPTACLGCGGWIPHEPGEGERVLCGRCSSLLAPPPPPRCPRCDIPWGTGHAPGRPCGQCSDWPPELDDARTAVLMEGPAPRLVHALKYQGWRKAAVPMARAMARRLDPRGGEAVLVPVPTTPARLRTRGYNQASELARNLSLLSRLPVVDALERRGGGPSQVALHPSQRRSNVRDAFGVPGGEVGIRGRHVILVDDVLTTGATGLAAAGALHGGGVAGVSLLAFARAVPGSGPAAPGPS